MTFSPQQYACPARGDSAGVITTRCDVHAPQRGTPVAVNVTGFPVIPLSPAVAVRVLGPGVSPRVQLPTVAMPSAPVLGVAPVTLPPPLATANVTTTPGHGLPSARVTRTAGGMSTGEPGWATCPSPDEITILAVGGGTMVTAAQSAIVGVLVTRTHTGKLAGVGTVAGARYNPAAPILPKVLLPPSIPLTDQV